MINPQVINTDVNEWFFGDTRSMVDSTTNKLRAKMDNTANRKAGPSNRGRHGIVGNNRSRVYIMFKREQNRYKAWASVSLVVSLFITVYT